MNNAEKLRALHGWAAIFWALNFPVVTIIFFMYPGTWAKVSIFYLVIVSIYANFGTEGGAWQASRSEVQAKQINTNEVTTKKLEVKGKK